MNALVVFESEYGNTEKIAKAIGEAIGVAVHEVSEVNPADLAGYDLLIIGSPTHGGWFTEGIRDLLKALPAFEGGKVAVFDTRTKKSIFGFAAPRMARSLQKKGWQLMALPEGFIVLGIQGPLERGELERASAWALSLLLKMGR